MKMPDISNIQLNGNSVTVDKIILDGVTLPLDGGGGGGDNAMKENVQGTLTSYAIPNGVTSIRYYAFAYLNSLESVTIPDSVTLIDSSAFQNCEILESVTIPDSVKLIFKEAFSGCKSLKYIKFSGLTHPNIYEYEIMTTYMEDILVPESAVSDYVAKFPLWENRIFADTHTHDYSVTELRKSDQTGSTPFTQLSDTALNTSNVSLDNLKRVYIGNNVTTIGDGTFQDIESASIFIPETNSLETIGQTAFYNTNVIGDLHLPNVTSIGDLAFNANSNMLSVTIGDRITSIGLLAFNSCYKLKSVTLLATTPPTLDMSAFESREFPIYVPAESVEAYKAASGWSNYASRIQAIPSV